MKFLKKFFLHSWKQYIIASILAIGLTILAIFSRKTFSLLFIADSFAIAGVVTILIGGLVLVGYFGGFDTLGYGMSYFVRKNKKYDDLFDYTEKKKLLRKSGSLTFMPYFIIGILFVIISFVLAIISKKI